MENQEIMNDVNSIDDAKVREAIENHFKTIQIQSMQVGAKACAVTIMEKIDPLTIPNVKPTLRDYKRVVKDIIEFCTKFMGVPVEFGGEKNNASE